MMIYQALTHVSPDNYRHV